MVVSPPPTFLPLQFLRPSGETGHGPHRAVVGSKRANTGEFLNVQARVGTRKEWCLVHSVFFCVMNTHRLVFTSVVGHYSKSVFCGNLECIQGLISDVPAPSEKKGKPEINLTATD